MEQLKQHIQDIIDFRDYIKANEIKMYNRNYLLISDIINFKCMLVKNQYMLLPGTPRNIEFAERFKSIFPNEQVNIPIKTSFSGNLVGFIRNNEDLNTAQIIDKLKQSAIILEKNENLCDYIDSYRVMKRLTGGKSTFIQIQFFENKYPEIVPRNGLSDYLRELNKSFHQTFVSNEEHIIIPALYSLQLKNSGVYELIKNKQRSKIVKQVELEIQDKIKSFPGQYKSSKIENINIYMDWNICRELKFTPPTTTSRELKKLNYIRDSFTSGNKIHVKVLYKLHINQFDDFLKKMTIEKNNGESQKKLFTL